MPTEIEAVTRGFADYQLRAAGREMRSRHGGPLLEGFLRAVSGTFALDTQEFTRPAELAKPFGWRASGRWAGLIAEADDRRLIRPPFWLPTEFDGAFHRRKSELFFNQGYPYRLVQRIEFANAQAGDLPPVQRGAVEALRWELTWEKSATGCLAVLSLELSLAEVPAGSVPAFQRELVRLASAAAEPLITARR